MSSRMAPISNKDQRVYRNHAMWVVLQVEEPRQPLSVFGL